MRLYEYETVDIFQKHGIPVPKHAVAASLEQARKLALEIGYPVVLKAQVLMGGRGLAGGIKTAASPEELELAVGELLNMDIDGIQVRRIMVCEKVDVSQEFYMGVTIDCFSGTPVLMTSTAGGVNIEETARNSPEKIASLSHDPLFDLYPYQSRTLLRKLGLTGSRLLLCADIMSRLYDIFTGYEAITAEINPLVILPNGKVLAADAKMEIDDSAISRLRDKIPDLSEREENALERKGKAIGVTYVDLDGDIGLISSGAGLGMATMDIIGKTLRPANFLETGGGITEELLYRCMELVMAKGNLRAILINLYGGINPIHEGAKGVVRYLKEKKVGIPVVAKALGNLQEETWEILRSGGVHVVTEPATEAAARCLMELLGPPNG